MAERAVVVLDENVFLDPSLYVFIRAGRWKDNTSAELRPRDKNTPPRAA